MSMLDDMCPMCRRPNMQNGWNNWPTKEMVKRGIKTYWCPDCYTHLMHRRLELGYSVYPPVNNGTDTGWNGPDHVNPNEFPDECATMEFRKTRMVYEPRS